jgi:Superinfection immunity protein
MNALAHSYVFWVALILSLLALYVLPTVIAAIRGVPGLGWIIVLNLLPTGVGWLAALIAALALPRKAAGRTPTFNRLPVGALGVRPTRQGSATGLAIDRLPGRS